MAVETRNQPSSAKASMTSTTRDTGQECKVDLVFRVQGREDSACIFYNRTRVSS